MEMLRQSITPYELAKREAEDRAKETFEQAAASAPANARNRHERRAAIAIERLEMRLRQFVP